MMVGSDVFPIEIVPLKRGQPLVFWDVNFLLFSQQPGHWSKSGLGRAFFR